MHKSVRKRVAELQPDDCSRWILFRSLSIHQNRVTSKLAVIQSEARWVLTISVESTGSPIASGRASCTLVGTDWAW